MSEAGVYHTISLLLSSQIKLIIDTLAQHARQSLHSPAQLLRKHRFGPRFAGECTVSRRGGSPKGSGAVKGRVKEEADGVFRQACWGAR
jgi:hypothetical protein